MTAKPTFFKLPLARFDLSLLPSDARTPGTEAFSHAVMAYFARQYESKGQQAIVAVDSDSIQVLTLPQDADPFEFVLSMLKAGRIKEALPYLEAISKTSPDSDQVLYNLGIAYSELGQLDEAIIRLKRAVKLNPTHAHVWVGIGVAYQRMGKAELAVEPLETAVRLAPNDGYARRNLGGLLLSQGQAAEAVSHLREARKSLSQDAQTVYGLAAALQAVGGQENEDEADELFLVVITKFPGSDLAERARQARTKRAHESMRAKTAGGLRPDVVMYMVGAFETLEKLGPAKARELTLEIVMKGQNGLDINDSDRKYKLSSLPGDFSGMQLVSIMYVGIKALDPNMDPGIDLSGEYEAALALKGT